MRRAVSKVWNRLRAYGLSTRALLQFPRAYYHLLRFRSAKKKINSTRGIENQKWIARSIYHTEKELALGRKFVSLNRRAIALAHKSMDSPKGIEQWQREVDESEKELNKMEQRLKQLRRMLRERVEPTAK